MAKHRRQRANRWVVPALGVLGVLCLVLAGTLIFVNAAPNGSADNAARLSCQRPVKVVTAASFAPVLAAMSAALGEDDCARPDVTIADGRAAVQKVADTGADVWIPDDSSWAGSADSLALAKAPAAGAGTVLATSPFYMVADRATGARLRDAGAQWLSMARLVQNRDDMSLVLRDPQGSGDGMLAAGAPAEAVWHHVSMDASALWLTDVKPKTRVVMDDGPALPTGPGEVGIVPEYALRPAMSAAGGDLTALPGTDHTALLRYTWLPVTAALKDPARAAALDRLRGRLTGKSAARFYQAAGLRLPGATAAPGGPGAALPAPKAKLFKVLDRLHADHVYTSWYVGARRTNLLVVVDVSGSMARTAPGSKISRIELVRRGSRSLIGMLPDDSRMGLWEFGSELAGTRDYRPVVALADLDGAHRAAMTSAVDRVKTRRTGTGLYDTILAAYCSARDAYRPGVPNQVVIFTDGRNEGDSDSPSSAALAADLKRAADPERPVLLSVVTFGTVSDAKVVEAAVKPVEGYVDTLSSADEVAAVFIHVAAGGQRHREDHEGTMTHSGR